MMRENQREDNTVYKVVVNHEEQYSIWPQYKESPRGWKDVGKTGTKEECLLYIKDIWTDMRPLSLRRKMEELEKNPPSPEPVQKEAPRMPSLVERLSQGSHPVTLRLRPERDLQCFKEALERKFVHVKFTDTRGGTELGFQLDEGQCKIDTADFASGSGSVHLEGVLTLDFERVRCIADIELATFSGEGQLVRIQ